MASKDWADIQCDLHNKIVHNEEVLINALTSKKWSLLHKFVRHAQSINCMTYEEATVLVRKERKRYGVDIKVYRIAAEDIIDWTKDYICHKREQTKVLTLFNIFIKIALEGQAHTSMIVAGLSDPLIPTFD